MSNFIHKSTGSFWRAVDCFRLFPARAFRLGRHLWRGLSGKYPSQAKMLGVSPYYLWCAELFFYLLDLAAVPELFETLADWLKWRTRPLTEREIQVAEGIFGETIDYRRVRVDETARVACRGHGLKYVSFFTINSWGHCRPDIFIHEMVHVWQYQRIGAVYIPLALLAQRTSRGYDYGGVGELEKAMASGLGLDYFNLEQQADIVSDGYCLRSGRQPRWSRLEAGDLGVFGWFFKDLIRKTKTDVLWLGDEHYH